MADVAGQKRHQIALHRADGALDVALLLRAEWRRDLDLDAEARQQTLCELGDEVRAVVRLHTLGHAPVDDGAAHEQADGGSAWRARDCRDDAPREQIDRDINGMATVHAEDVRRRGVDLPEFVEAHDGRSAARGSPKMALERVGVGDLRQRDAMLDLPRANGALHRADGRRRQRGEGVPDEVAQVMGREMRLARDVSENERPDAAILCGVERALAATGGSSIDRERRCALFGDGVAPATQRALRQLRNVLAYPVRDGEFTGVEEGAEGLVGGAKRHLAVAGELVGCGDEGEPRVARLERRRRQLFRPLLARSGALQLLRGLDDAHYFRCKIGERFGRQEIDVIFEAAAAPIALPRLFRRLVPAFALGEVMHAALRGREAGKLQASEFFRREPDLHDRCSVNLTGVSAGIEGSVRFWTLHLRAGRHSAGKL